MVTSLSLAISLRGMPDGRWRAIAAFIGLPCGQVVGWPRRSSMAASTRGEMALWSRIASSSDSAQPSPTTLVSSHSIRAWRWKMVSAASQPAGVRARARSGRTTTSPSADRRLTISEAAWTDTCMRRASDAVIGAVPEPSIERKCQEVDLRGFGRWVVCVVLPGHAAMVAVAAASRDSGWLEWRSCGACPGACGT